MSVQFGRWNFDGKPVQWDYLEKVKSVIAPYGPDDNGSYAKTSINILYHAFRTTKESHRERQPHITESGAVITWDGRLDNRAELTRELSDVLTISSTDVSLVAGAYEKWGTGCFGRLIGDWAFSIWDADSRSLILAKDPIGARHLFYSIEKDQVTWSTILDPLVLFAGRSFVLNGEYLAGWLSFFPAAHLTPYVGIHSVPPSSCVTVRAGKHTIGKYWDFDPAKRIRYRTDAEYEEHFRVVFGKAVRRRLRSDNPILAELSGGVDSSSIVCVADTIIARGSAETPRLDTISYHNDSEPNWNERPYFTKVEEKRGRTGCHIDVGKQGFFGFEVDSDHFAATPGSVDQPNKASKQFVACMTSGGNRVVLSGIGGDEVTGGVPTPAPEIEDLLVRGQFRTLAHQLKVWALNKRKPWFHLFFEAASSFFPPTLFGVPKHMRPAQWLHPDFVKQNRAALRGYQSRVKMLGPLPTFQGNLNTLEGIRRLLGSDALHVSPTYEKRYPFLDRDLLEFVYAIPREQLLRPGQRRSLMRRALVGIVPDEILSRKRKAFVSRRPLVAISTEWNSIVQMHAQMTGSFFRMVDPEEFMKALQNARQGQVVPLVPLLRTLAIETWLAQAMKWKLFHDPRNEGNMAETQLIGRDRIFVSTQSLSALGKHDKERR
jgi:asparagine synthase (glutamine-hydrolysing)